MKPLNRTEKLKALALREKKLITLVRKTSNYEVPKEKMDHISTIIVLEAINGVSKTIMNLWPSCVCSKLQVDKLDH